MPSAAAVARAAAVASGAIRHNTRWPSTGGGQMSVSGVAVTPGVGMPLGVAVGSSHGAGVGQRLSAQAVATY